MSPEEFWEYGDDILPRFGPTYVHHVRNSVASHDAERTIPGAIRYLQTHEDPRHPGRNARYAELLNGDLFQAERLWRIRGERDPHRAAQMWFRLAQDLRDGVGFGLRNDAHTDILSNLDFSRAILDALHHRSPDPTLRSEARRVYQDSIGSDITDDEGNIIEEGGGELGLWQPDWFRNFSDEEAQNVTSEGILLGASVLAGGGAAYGGFRLSQWLTRTLRPGFRSLARINGGFLSGLLGASAARWLESIGPSYQGP